MTACVSSKQKSNVQKSMRLRSVSDLLAYGLLFDGDITDLQKLEGLYDIGVSSHIAALLKNRSSQSDPIARQYIPSREELTVMPDEEYDPIGDDIYSPVNGIVHCYPDRALFKVTNVCAVYCRYCFRRDMIGAGSDHLTQSDFDVAIDYIKAHKEIWEVILTGGDPFVLSPRRLEQVIHAINDIDHVQSLRIHTRVPIADPSKIDNTILSVLKYSRKAIHIVAHVNHRDEITPEVEATILKLRRADCSLYAQSVLLKGVNDNAKTLEDLFRKLISIHVKPYYLHHLDRAKGTSHFRVSLERGQKIMKDLQGRVSGLCLPKYMLDIPGGHGKIPANESYIRHILHDTYSVEDYQGCDHLYFDTQKENQEGEAS